MRVKQYFLTPADGKKLIAKGVAAMEAVREALDGHSILIAAGTTNAYLARELLASIGDEGGFDPFGYYRGITTAKGMEPKRTESIGDVLIENGRWVRGTDAFQAAPALGEGDVLIKGGNAVNLADREAAVLIGHPAGGSSMPIISATVGRRARCIVPIGVEKRVSERISRLAALVNAPGAEGPRLLPIPGEVFTELDAIRLLTDAQAELLAAGGVCGAEGGCYFAVRGGCESLERMDALLRQIAQTPDISYLP